MTDNKNNTRPLCPRCLKKGLKVYLHKAGGGVSGKRRCQQYRCPECLHPWLNTKEDYTRIKDRK